MPNNESVGKKIVEALKKQVESIFGKTLDVEEVQFLKQKTQM